MNKLLSEVGRILDLPEDYLSTMINEADNKEKLRNTYMFVNGELAYISKFLWNKGLIEVYNNNAPDAATIEVHSLEPWLPLSGLYVSKEVELHMMKHPNKQWRKSFALDNYVLKYLSPLSDTTEKNLLPILSKMTPTNMEVIGDTVYFGSKIIGSVNKHNIVTCSATMFYQELLDFIKKRELNWLIK